METTGLYDFFAHASGTPAIRTIPGALQNVNDVVQTGAGGQTFATVKFSSDATFNGTVQPEYSKDGGKNWLPAPYATRVDAVSANPTTSATVSFSASPQTWEVPIPGNCTHFRVRATSITAGSASAITITEGALFASGVPVVAVLYDVTSGTNAALDTGTLDTSGWVAVEHMFLNSGGIPSFTINEIDDAGNTVSPTLITNGSAQFMGGLGGGLSIGGSGGNLVSTPAGIAPLPRRTRYQSAAIVGQTSRIRVVARR